MRAGPAVFILSLLGLTICFAAESAAQSAYDDVPVQIDPESCPEQGGDWTDRALIRSQTRQLGLPEIAHPTENPPTAAKIELGRKLFFDRRLSINKTMSCAMCHVPEQGFANWEMQTAIGVEGRSLKRNAPTIVNVGFMSPLFHDGRDVALETQFVGPMVARNEMANPSVGRVIELLKKLADYEPFFDAAFDAPASLDRVGMAIGAYQRSATLGNSAFDRWYYGGETEALSQAQQRGFAIFSGDADCTSCHLISETDALFTDLDFHDTGYGWLREQARQSPPATTKVQVAPGVILDVKLATIASISLGREADLGRYEVTENPADRWKFRTPSLRNVAMTRPYMHDGALGTLGEVIRFYDGGGSGRVGQDPRIRPLGLTDQDKADLEAFLISLTSLGINCLAAEARSHPPDNH